MKFQKRRPQCKTIEDVVLENVGKTKEDFLMPQKAYYIKGLKEANLLLNIAGSQNQTINVVGDYDVDGICASSILSLTFKEKGWRHNVRLPRRFSEGYGLSEKIIDEIEDGLLITVDNGITAANEIEKAKNKGLTVIVTDHHLPDAEQNIPKADVVINPNAIPNTAEFNGYCGAGIAYKLAIDILGEDHKLIPKLQSLAAIATIADVMPLVEENRLIVKNGLSEMLKPYARTVGLGELIAECKQEKYFSAKNVAFKLAPMINAPGRMQDDGATISYDILTFEGDKYKAQEKASFLSDINNQRKEAKETGLKILHENIKENSFSNCCPLIVYEPHLPEGLVGIYAGQLAEEFKVPCFVLTDSDEPNIAKGSGRTYGNINIKELLDKHYDILYKYGGHSDAAGISIEKDKIKEFRSKLEKELSFYKPEEVDTTFFDLSIEARQIPIAIKNLDVFEPFGQGNPEVVFYIKNYIVNEVKYLQDGKTVKFVSGNGDAICFEMGEKYKQMGEPKIIDLVGTISRNCYMSSVKNQVEVTHIIKPENKKIITPMAEMLANMAAQRNS